MLLLQQLIGLLLITLAYGDDCPIFFNPPEMVVEYEASILVNCSTNMTDNFDLSWEAYPDTMDDTEKISKSVNVTDWEMQLTCYIHSNETQCSENLPVIIYKTPDSVSIITLNHNGPMMSGNQYELQCDVLNVAPVQYLTVKWYKGQTLVDQTIFNDTIKTPVNKTSKLLIRPDRADDGAQYRCEAELELGEKGPQPPPKVKSDPLNITVHYDCPIFFNPPEMVVEYEASILVNCSTNMTDNFDLSWEAYPDTMDDTEEISKSVNVMDWEMQLTCYIHSNETQCSENLPVIIYKTPDSVSIITVNHTGPMMSGNQYELQCDVLNVAPVQYLTVKWYKGQTLVDQTIFNDTIKTPVNKTSKLLIRPDRADDGAQYRCEAELELGEERPQPPPNVTSDPLNITVHFKPIINKVKLPSAVTVFRGYPEVLVCEAEGNPKPTICWNRTNDIVCSENLNITDSTPEDLSCIANNSVGSITRHVKVSKHDSDCPIQLIPRRVVVKFGGSVSVDCSTSVPHEGMGWEANEGGVSLNKNSLITWRVSELREWDIQPFCYINHKEQCQTNLPVTIYKTPDSVSIITVNHNGPMIEGNQYELQCDVLNVAPVQNLTVKWYKGQTLVDQTNFTDTIKTPVSETSKLLIRPDRADDGAQYRCEAELELGEEGPQPPPKVTSDPLSITVHYKPQITRCKDWSPTAGTSLDSYLDSNPPVGNPRPNISWRRKSSLVNASILLNTYDSDRYEITAINELGNSTCNLSITVEYPPELNCNESYDVKENTPFQLTCADGLPKPDVDLYKNGKKIQLPYYPRWNDGGLYQFTARNKHGTVNSTFNLKILYKPQIKLCEDWSPTAGTSLDSYLNLNPPVGNPHPNISWRRKSSLVNASILLTTYDSDRYEITAINELGNSTCNLSITVEYPPELNCNESYDVKENTPFQLTCADGLPKPHVDLYKNGKRIQHPYNPKWNDSGLYQFTASNKHGTVNSTFNLKILYAPVIFASRDRIVEVEDNITLECNSTGNPEPEMWWSFQNTNISTGRRHITVNIERATSARAGVYTCTATNEFGRKEKTVTVEIRDNSSYMPIIAAVLATVVLLLLIIAVFVFLWRRNRSTGSYQIQPEKHEMCPLNNGGKC